ncbi:ATP-cone domain-containing protein [Entamoeba marina]
MSATTLITPEFILKRDAVKYNNFDTPKETIDEAVAKVCDSLKASQIDTPKIEDIQDYVEKALMSVGSFEVAKKYMLYREERHRIRMSDSRLMQTYQGLTSFDAKDMDIKRENANVDGNSSMGLMLKFGSEGSTEFSKLMLMKPEHALAHEERRIHIHDLDFFAIGTTTCCQIDLTKLFENGFSTGHGTIRTPNDIATYAALACIVLQSNQNEQHGGQSIPLFDYSLADGVKKTYFKCVCEGVRDYLEFQHSIESDNIKTLLSEVKDSIAYHKTEWSTISKFINEKFNINSTVDDMKKVESIATRLTDRKTFQAMEALIHNLNTMHSRAGSQVPFTSINFGTDISDEGRLVSKMLLKATWNGLGNGETAIFPISIFKVKEGINYNPEDPNYDLFKLAIKVSAKRLFPNFVFIDAPFNIKTYNPKDIRTETVAMGCRTRVVSSVFPETNGIVTGRGNLSFTTLNLPRIGIKHGIVDGTECDMEGFYKELQETLDLCANQLMERFKLQCNKKAMNFPFLLGQGLWHDSDKLQENDNLYEVLKHGTLSIGFIGLAETLVALTGKHHAESEECMKLGLEIIQKMRTFCDEASKKYTLNFSLLGTPAEGLSGRFVAYDAKKYGLIKGITDREYYTNSFHVPVYYPISAANKIKIEAPYHNLCNAGHITYVEVDGDPLKNLDAFEQIVRMMKESGIGYGSINHPVDRDPTCGYNGIIGNECPQCHRKETESERFERLRRITGYLVGSLDRWNNAKKAEERDRVKHA